MKTIVKPLAYVCVTGLLIGTALSQVALPESWKTDILLVDRVVAAGKADVMATNALNREVSGFKELFIKYAVELETESPEADETAAEIVLKSRRAMALFGETVQPAMVEKSRVYAEVLPKLAALAAVDIETSSGIRLAILEPVTDR